MSDMLHLVESSPKLSQIVELLSGQSSTVHLSQMVGGAFSLYAAAAVERMGGVHIFVADDRDAAAYLANDFYALLDESSVYFFPSAYKRSIAYSQQDAQGVVQRTAALTAVRNFQTGSIVLCTYPEALAETVADRRRLSEQTMRLSVGDRIDIDRIVERLEQMEFEKVEFVYQPGQYSVRGGIVDIFSYAESKPYRIDMFGDEIDSLRRFDISSQLSAERPDSVEIIPNMTECEAERVSLARFVGGSATMWFSDADFALRRINDIRRKLLEQLDEPSAINSFLTSRNALLADMQPMRVAVRKDNVRERAAANTVELHTSPQPAFNKNFEMLADDIISQAQRGYKTYILSQNKIQLERLDNIFHQIGRRNVRFDSLPITLHEGFVDNDLRLCLYTDHQIFDRYQRYRLRGEIKRDEQMTVAELNALKVGDYVVHIDHGVGRFGGLVKLNDNGRMKEA
ncbi:MAG: transcription-repair coupling factor, partial [Alistipes sp.]|nr:transcription-repair coupling factor [Alistipes sp.]